ncbi:MAG: Unknown protein [uncultured Sulfurovum sp.]|uniref:Uncharacterized protein n=1 Tax=uncultured Sulfurovum sp. TaxID=269237 RepID=A0A6S6U7L3_9BACT|nr:MAG: Unknown protein [uncultured Sulfurovum sp.]
MILKKIILTILFTTLLFGENEFKKPESFKDYKQYILDDMMVFISPKLTKYLKIKEVKRDGYDKNIHAPVKTMFLTIKGEELKLFIDPGASDDFSFVFNHKGKERMIAGESVFISQSGTIYISNRMNENYEVKRKFQITKSGVKELKQAFLSVNMDCETSALATLYTEQGGKGTIVAKIPKGKKVKVLVNAFTAHNSELETDESKNYLVQTSFGLVGWVRSSAGYMQEKGKPLGCLMYEGD